jgi:hypothetical protein
VALAGLGDREKQIRPLRFGSQTGELSMTNQANPSAELRK